MKVCHIVPGYYPLLGAPVAYSTGLVEAGYEVTVIAYGQKNEARREEYLGVNLIRIPLTPRKGFSPGNARRFIKQCGALIREGDYNLVHIYAFRACGLLPLLHRRYANAWLMDLRTGNVNANVVVSSLANKLMRLESRWFGAIITIDQRVGERVFGRNRSFSVVPIGADLQRFKPSRNFDLRKKLGFGAEHLVAIFTSSLVRQRYPERVLEAFRAAQREVPNLRLLVVGPGDMLAALRQLSDDWGLAEHIKFTGLVNYEMVADYIAVADMGIGYVPLSRQYDLQPPLKTIEFMAAGLPTLVTGTAGNLLFVRHEENGWVTDDTVEAVAQGMVRLANDSDLRQRLAANARKSVEQYDWRRIVQERLIPVYDRLLAAGQG